jgi:hypothetical protein
MYNLYFVQPAKILTTSYLTALSQNVPLMANLVKIFRLRKQQNVKGKGEMITYLLQGRSEF